MHMIFIGWPTVPLTSNVDIIVNGSSSVNIILPNGATSIGSRVIGVLGGLDLHGIRHNVTWTRLASTASAGQTSITLSQAVDWIIGDEIVLTTTDTRIGHVERRSIIGITGGGTVLTLNSALLYTHLVIHNVFANGEIYHMAGAVGLLTRNVRVINRSPASEKFGFRIIVTDYATNVWNPVGSEYIYTYYKGYARLSDTQFIGFGQFVDAPNEDKREAIHLYNLGDWNSSRPTYVDSCSFDTGYYSAYVLL
jgi:G8 domain